MYIILNSTTNTKAIHEGGFPNLDEELNRGDKIVIISSYSNSIKVPYSYTENGIIYWEWDSYNY